MQADAGPAQTAPAAQPPLKEPEQSADAVLIGRVTRVSDGDTIRVELSSGPITVRLDGVDAPEKDQPWGREAASALSDWVLDRDVELAVVTQDQYDRLVAQVVIGDLRVNERLVKDGHAWAFRRYLKQSQASYCSFESAARAARRGLWSLDAREWVYPSDWRRLQRRTTDRVEDFSAETAERCRAAIGKR
jgi:endonuclease YncB( thermonuclease family)